MSGGGGEEQMERKGGQTVPSRDITQGDQVTAGSRMEADTD